MPGSPVEATYKHLNRATLGVLYGFSLFYEFRLLMSNLQSVLYTFEVINLMNPSARDIMNGILIWDSVLSSFLSMGAGLLFFYFAYYIHVAHGQKELYASGIENMEPQSEDPQFADGGVINQSSSLTDDIGYLPPRLSEDYVRINSIKRPL